MEARQVFALGGAAFGALAALNSALGSAPVPPLPSTSGKQEQFAWSDGIIRYTIAGQGAPIALLHGPGIAASSFEMRYLTEALAGTYSVIAPDLLGFGLSERPEMDYSGDLYVRMLQDFLREVVQQPTIVIASGLSGLYAVATAAKLPEQVKALVLSAPPLLTPRDRAPGTMRRVTDTLLRTPIVGRGVFNTVTGRNSIRADLRDHAYANPELVTESMVDAQYAMARQPNARYAVQALLLGKLHIDIVPTLDQLGTPLLAVFGAQATPDSRAIAAEYVRHAPRTQVAIIERAGGLPHEEQAEHFGAIVTSWLNGLAAKRG